MYKLEDRILFDGAAVADVTEAQQEAEAQQLAAEEAAAAAAAEAQQDAADDGNTDTGDDNSLADVLAEINAGNLGADGQRVDVLLVSSSLENADDICNSASADTLVVVYDARTASAADLLQQITTALDGKVADSIGFVTESGENAQVQLFADTDTSLETVNDEVHQNFFSSLNSLLDEGGQVNLFASNLASTAEGEALVDAMSDALGHDVAASTDETGGEAAGGDWDLEYSTSGAMVDVAETYLDENLADNFDALLEDHASHEVVFINSSVMNVDEILDDLGYGVEVVMLDQGDAFQQITDYLQDKTGIDAIHIVSHGNEGFFRLGNDTINAQFVQEHQIDFTAWGHSLIAGGDIMIYGCNLAAGAEGQNLVQIIADFTGADVAASTDGTGISGDWELEYSVGKVETAALAVNDYMYNLANITVNNITDDPLGTLGDGIYTLRKAIAEALAGDEIIFAASSVLDPTKPSGSGVADYTIYLNASLGQIDVDKNITINGYISLPDSAHTFAKVDGRSLTVSDSLPASTVNQDFYNSSGTAIKAYDAAHNEIDFSTFTADQDLDVYDISGSRIAIYNQDGAQLNTIKVTNGGTTYTLTVIDTDDSPVGGVSNAAGKRVMFVKAVSDADNYVTLKNLVIQNGRAVSTGGSIPSDGDGGGIYIDVNSKVVMNEVTVRTSTADISGGGIYNAGILHIERTTDEDTMAILNNTAGNSGGGIFNGSTGTLTVLGFDVNHEVQINNNTATAGSGGGIYSVGDIDVRLTWLESNSAAGGSGGAIAIENGGGDSYFYQIEAHNNTAYVNGGGLSYTQGSNVTIEWSKFNSNTATTGYGGGLYFANNSGNLIIRTADDSFGANTHTYFSYNRAGINGGGLYVDQSGNVSIDFVEFYDNTANTATGYGGAIFMQNSGNITISEGDFDSNTARYGGGIYYDGSGTMTISASDIVNGGYGWQGGAIYQLTGALNITNTTLAYNNASYGGSIYMGDNSTLSLSFATVAYNSANAGYAIYMTDSAGSSFSSIDSIYFNTSATVGNEITLGSSVTVSNSTYNVYSRYGGSKFAGTGNITDSTLIENQLYLDTVLRRQGNYRTQTLALLYKESIAYTTGTSVSGITHDQRGNNRVGTDVNGDSNGTPSIGAFEPIYYITVGSKGDVSDLQFTSSQGGHYFSEAQEDGITLREAIYWIDNYNRQQAYDDGLYDADRWVKFDSTLFAADSDNTILITQGQIEVGDVRYGFAGQAKEVMLSSVQVVDPLDTRDYGDINDPVAFRAQDASGRIIVDGNGNDTIFSIVNTSATFYINNITITNGHETNNSDGKGGGLRNQGYVILNNIVVSNCIADNTDIDATYSNGGFGGGIYNSGTMQIYDSTITENSAVAYASSDYQPSRAGLGGGIYNSGTLTIERSTISNNSVSGNIQYVTSESVVGAGLYNTIQTENWIVWDFTEWLPEVRKVTGSGTLNVANSTIVDNTVTATEAASGTNPAGSGSAIYMKDGDLTLYYNTIVNNHTNLNSGATASESHAAVSVRGGMEYSFTFDGKTDTYTSYVDLYLSNSILADNTVQVTASTPVQIYADLYINNTALTTNVNVINSTPIGDYNIIGSYNYDSDTGDGYNWDVRNNQVGDSFGYVVNLNIDSQLRYNGAKTMTYRLLDGSVAVGTGSLLTSAPYTSAFTSLATDQRGVSRTMADRNGNIVQNIGSYESLTLLTITSQEDSGVEPTNEGFDFATNKLGWETDEVSFRDAIYWADTEALITIDASSWTSAIVELAGAITISNGITIDGTLTGSTFGNALLDAGNKDRAFIIDNIDYLPLVSVGLKNMTIQNGNASVSSYSGHGGAIYSKETLTLTSVTIQDSTAAGKGGGIFSQTGDLTVNQSTISGNTAGTGAGGIYTEANTFSAYQSSILSNTTTTGDGGGFYALGATVSFNASTIGLNTSTAGHGGGLYINSSSFEMLNSTISNNAAGLNGGGISFNGGGTYSIDFATIANNISGTAEGSQYLGGGLYLAAGNLTLSNSVIANNYHYSIAEANRDDFYLAGGNVTSATYNAIGVSSGYVFDVATDHNVTYANDPDFFNKLGLDTTLTDNGGPTLTLYVFNTDTILQDNADQTTTVTVDQRGEARNAPTVTIGAYQKNITSWVYVGPANATAADLNTTGYWRDATTGAVVTGNVVVPDRTLYFDPTRAGGIGTDNVIITETWDVNYKTSVVVDGSGHLTVDGTSTFTAGLSVMGASIFTVGSNAAFAAALNTNVAISESGSQIIVNNTFSGTVNVSAGTLELKTADANLVNLTLGAMNSTSTVIYSYDDAQTIRTGDYGNLTVSGAGTKTANGIITVAGDLSNDSKLVSGYDITVTGNTTGSGSITGANIYLNGTSNTFGDLTAASGTVTFGGGTSIGTITAVTVNAEGTVTNVEATTLNATDNLTINGTVNATTVDANSFALTVDGGIVNTTNLTATTLNLNNGASVNTVNAQLTNINSSSGVNALTATAASVVDVNYSDWVMNVSGASTFTIDRGSNNIDISDGSVTPSFNINNMTVAGTATLKFVTTGDATLTNINSNTLSGVYDGTLWIKSDDITLGGCDFSGGNMSLVIENSGYFNLATSLSATVFKNDIIINNVRITAGTGNTAYLQSSQGSITIGNVISVDPAYSLSLRANSGSVTIGAVSGMTDISLNAGVTATVDGKINISGALTVNATTGVVNSTVTAGEVTVNGNLTLSGNITADGNTMVTGTTTVSGNSSIVSNGNLTFSGIVDGAGNLTLSTGGTGSFVAGANMTGNLSLVAGAFASNSDISAANLSILSPAALDMNSNDLTVTSGFTNAGQLLDVGTATVGGSITNTGTMNVTNLSIVDDSVLSLGGTVGDFTAINLASGKNAQLTSGNITTAAFTFSGADSGSVFSLGSGTTLTANTINYNASATYYAGNYFNTAGGGKLVRTMDSSDIEYRVGNDTSAIVVTLNGTAGEKIAVGVINGVTVNGETVTGIEETVKFTTVIDRNYGGTSYTNDLVLGINWPTAIEGTGFDTSDVSLFSYADLEWTADSTVMVTDPSTGRHAFSNYTLAHNGTYTVANTDADMTVPPVPNNVNIYEMANAHFVPFNARLDTNIFLEFPVGVYPYFQPEIYATAENTFPLGRAIYRQMEYRLVTDPQTNPLGGQVPPPGAVLGQVITEGASLTLTSDAPVYLVADGEYSAGEGWLPITEPASVENIEQYQEPITEGQINEFYLDFGSREDIFSRPVSFKSDLDAMLDDLLAG